jgi:hypothetical protein
MSPNPTARPFIVGALLFLALIGLWPAGARAHRAEDRRPGHIGVSLSADPDRVPVLPARPRR